MIINLRASGFRPKASFSPSPILWLSASVAFAAAPQQKKHKNFKETAQLKGRPDNGGRSMRSRRPRSRPLPVPPPYKPVPMTADIGTTGMVVYSNTNGVALINPRNHTISPILLNEFDSTIDPETDYPIGGQLGSEGGGRFDVAMTSDGSQALISNFGDSKVFFVDLSSGTPVVSGMAKIDFFAEDIAIDPTNEWALVTDGGFAPAHRRPPYPHPHLGPGRSGSAITPKPISYTLPDPVIEIRRIPIIPSTAATPTAVDIAPDGRTVIVADYFNGAIHVLLFDPATGALSLSADGNALEIRHRRNRALPFPVSPGQRRHLPRRPHRHGGQFPTGAPYTKWPRSRPGMRFTRAATSPCSPSTSRATSCAIPTSSCPLRSAAASPSSSPPTGAKAYLRNHITRTSSHDSDHSTTLFWSTRRSR